MSQVSIPKPGTGKSALVFLSVIPKRNLLSTAASERLMLKIEAFNHTNPHNLGRAAASCTTSAACYLNKPLQTLRRQLLALTQLTCIATLQEYPYARIPA